MILSFLKNAELNPVHRPVDPRKLARQPLFRANGRVGQKIIETFVSVPEEKETENEVAEQKEGKPPFDKTTPHMHMQYLLLKLGADMGLDVWVARNDRSRSFNGEVFGSLPKIVSELPTQFNEATQRTIELIDVLWLKGNSITAAFEVESTTSIYSGLLRMSDLLALQPNLEIRLYLELIRK